MGWRSMGIKTLSDFYDNNVLKSFKQLKDTFNLPAVHFFKYLYIKMYLFKSAFSLKLGPFFA